MSDFFYITTTLPYINAAPHLGFAWEIVTADIIARFQRLQGKKVIFNTGTDEHGQKIYQQALAENLSAQDYADRMSQPFAKLSQLLDLSTTHFIRTTDTHHQQAAQTLWRLCQEHGDIYQQAYQSQYCVGCELNKTDSELVDGHCPLHPNLKLEQRSETNYFFRFSRYQDQLLDLYHKQPDFVIGQGKKEELVSFVKQGLHDFSISRVKEKMPWGVPVPGDDSQVMYVWFDALTNYISTLGWPDDSEEFNHYWPGVQVCGKDNLRQQAAMWQAMLMSAGLPTSRQILVNGFITVDGQKMSKSLGNVISPHDLVSRYGQQATRFLLASLPVWSDDVDITTNRLDDLYLAQLTNGLGNLASRLAKLASLASDDWHLTMPTRLSPVIVATLTEYHTHQALQVIIDHITALDTTLNQRQPWAIKDVQQKVAIMHDLLLDWLQLVYDLQLFMPQISQQLQTHFTKRHIIPLKPLFPRLG